MFRKTQIVAENQRVLVFKNQELDRVLTPGKYCMWDIKNELEFITFDINNLYFKEKNAERLYRHYPELSHHISHYQLGSTEAGLLYVNDLLRGVVAPSTHLYLWKESGEIRLDKVPLEDNIDVDEHALFLINRAGANIASRLIKNEQTVAIKPISDLYVSKNHIGLLYVNGQLVKQLTPGQHGFWQFNHTVEVKSFDCRAQMLEISGQEILSKDRVSLRINLNASIQVKDAELAARSVDDVDDFIYKTLQLALREAVGTNTNSIKFVI